MPDNNTSMSVYLHKPNVQTMLANVLGSRAPQFVTSLCTLTGNNKALNACTKQSLLGCALKAASMNLSLDQNLGFAWAIPYGSVATFQIGEKGYVQLAMRSGQYRFLGTRDVREGEFKGRNFVGDPEIEWLPDEEREDKKVIGYMAGLELLNGFRKTIYWTVEQVKKHAEKYSQGYRSFLKFGASKSTSKSGNRESPWASNFDAMAEKTVLKSLISKYGAMSTELGDALKYDQAAIEVDEDTGEETVEYMDNDNTDKEHLSTNEQEEILKKYGPGNVEKACKIMGIKVIGEVTKGSLESFKEILEGMN